MTTVSIHMSEQTGQTGLTLFLRKTSDGTLVNTGGDALTEAPASSGRFTADVGEAWAETLAASVRNAASLTIRDGWLASGETIVRDAYPSAGGGGGAGDAEQATSLEILEAVDSIAVALAGGSPVESTGRIAQGGKVIAYIGDDFRVRSGTALPIPVKDPAGALKAKLEAIGLGNLFFGAAPKNGPVGAITGTVAGITAAAGITTISVEISNCGVDLMPGSMPYQIQQSVAQGSEFDDFVELEGTLILNPRTVAVRK